MMKTAKPDRKVLIAFARKHVHQVTEDALLEELRGGYLNFVWRVQNATGNSFIIKHAPVYIASMPHIPLDDSRIVFEGRILRAFQSRNELTPLTALGVRPPEFLAADNQRHLLLMEDVDTLPDLGRVFSTAGYDVPLLAGHLGKFIGQLHLNTYRNNWFAEKFCNLPVQQTRLQVQYNGCQEFCIHAGIGDADDIGRRCRQLGEKFNSVGKCLIMGDLSGG